MAGRKVPHLLLLAAAADETEDYLLVIGQTMCCPKQRIEWVTRTVIAGVHNYETLLQIMLPAKCFSSLTVKPDSVVVSPGRQNDDPILRHAFGHDSLFHELIQCNGFFGVEKAVA